MAQCIMRLLYVLYTISVHGSHTTHHFHNGGTTNSKLVPLIGEITDPMQFMAVEMLQRKHSPT